MRVNPGKPNISGVLQKLKKEGGIKYGDDPRKLNSQGIRDRLNRFETMPEVRAQAAKDSPQGTKKRIRKTKKGTPPSAANNTALLGKILNKGE